MNEHLWAYTDDEWQERLDAFSAADLAWCAGFFDGEGCVHVGYKKRPANRGPWFHVRVSVNNTNRDALERLQDLFRGTICTRKPVENRKRVHGWYIDSKNAERFLAAIQPFVLVKARQVGLGLEMRYLLSQHDPRRGVPTEVYERLVEIAEQVRQANGRNYQKATAKVPENYTVEV